MKAFRFEPKAEVIIGGEILRLLETYPVDGEPVWRLLKLRSGEITVLATAELARLYEAGDLVCHRTDAAGAPVDRRDLSEADRRRRSRRREFLDRVYKLVGSGGWQVPIPVPEGAPVETPLSRALAKVSGAMAHEKAIAEGLCRIDEEPPPFKIVCKATFYAWRRIAGDEDDSRRLEGDFHRRGQATTVPDETRAIVIAAMAASLDKHLTADMKGAPATLTFEQRTGDCKTAIEQANLRLPEGATKHVLPSRTTQFRYWNTFPSFERAIATKGREEARRLHRTAVGYERENAPLGIVQYDETRTPFVLFDSRHGLPLGKANLCAAIDEASFGLTGFNLSFRPFSVSTMLSTFRHGCTLKGYVATEYPKIGRRWLPSGKPRCVSCDNSLSATSRTLELFCQQIDCDPARTQHRTPWAKPLIENFFHRLNEMLLKHLPGFDPGQAMHVRDYDPTVSGVIDMQLFLYIFHWWVLRIYHRKPVPLLGRCPDEAWEEGVARTPAGLLDSMDDLDSLFSTLFEASLDHRGVLLNAIWYSSEELRDTRYRLGSRPIRVRCKMNEEDVTVLRVEHPRERGHWLRLTARRPSYPRGTSRHVHELVRKGLATKGREFNEHTALEELSELRALFKDAAGIYDAARTRTLLARAEGFGTENLFADLDVEGNLGPAKGPFTGSRLNAIVEGPHAPLPIEPPPEAPAKRKSRAAKPEQVEVEAEATSEFEEFEVYDNVEKRA